MPAYYRAGLAEFIEEEPQAVIGQLQIKYAEDGFAQQYLTQNKAWAEVIPLLQAKAQTLVGQVPAARSWTIRLEFPPYRLQRRVDIVVLTASILVIESKVGEEGDHPSRPCNTKRKDGHPQFWNRKEEWA